MDHVTRILNAAHQGEKGAAEHLLPLVYDELRRLAAAKITQEKPGHTLQATALVHEAYLRLVGSMPEQNWSHRGHFFAAAAEAMRRILVESARRKRSLKRGGDRQREPLNVDEIVAAESDVDLVALDEALTRLGTIDPVSVQLVQLRYFSGLTLAQAAEALDLAPRTADRIWAFARAWLYRELAGP